MIDIITVAHIVGWLMGTVIGIAFGSPKGTVTWDVVVASRTGGMLVLFIAEIVIARNDGDGDSALKKFFISYTNGFALSWLVSTFLNAAYRLLFD